MNTLFNGRLPSFIQLTKTEPIDQPVDPVTVTEELMDIAPIDQPANTIASSEELANVAPIDLGITAIAKKLANKARLKMRTLSNFIQTLG
jgi:hypothetical protein